MKSNKRVEDFTANDQNGNPVQLLKFLENGPVVLFFYPKAMSMVCTKESCHFRDTAQDFAALGAQIIGISTDSEESQKEFDNQHNLGFPLLSDKSNEIAKQFGAYRGLLPNKRITFVISQDGDIIGEFKNELQADVHADQALEVLTKLRNNS